MSEEIKDGGPVFPADPHAVAGMALRDYFAAKAIPALIENFAQCLDSNGEGFDLSLVGNEGGTPDAIAEDAYAIADAMLRARAAK